MLFKLAKSFILQENLGSFTAHDSLNVSSTDDHATGVIQPIFTNPFNNDDYIAKAIEFSSNLSALEMLRQSLRENLLKTPLFDLPRFANNFEKALWEMRDTKNH